MSKDVLLVDDFEGVFCFCGFVSSEDDLREGSISDPSQKIKVSECEGESADRFGQD